MTTDRPRRLPNLHGTQEVPLPDPAKTVQYHDPKPLQYVDFEGRVRNFSDLPEVRFGNSWWPYVIGALLSWPIAKILGWI